MIARRLAAVITAAALIVGAVLIRNQVIESGDDEQAADLTTLICAAELAAACQSFDGLSVRVEEAGDTLDRLAAADDRAPGVVWLTFDPFPAMVDSLRGNDSRDLIAWSATSVGSSDVALVASPATATTIGSTCGVEVAWRCLADLDLRVGFARTSGSATGLFGVTQAALGYDASGLTLDDAQFGVWLRRLLRSVAPSQLSGGTAIGTLLTRPSSMDVAVGVAAQLGANRRSDVEVAYAAPMIRADVVLAVPAGASMPSGLVSQVSTALSEAGWEAPAPSTESLEPTTLLAIRSLWESLR